MSEITNKSLLDKSEIYMITNKVTGKKYIGQVQCIFVSKDGVQHKRGCEIRFNNHVAAAKKNRGGRLLSESIRTYGRHNHLVKPIFICPNYQADYWERKFIRQFNTQSPNGLNITIGGKKPPMAEETRKLMSLINGGENNPMWGKHHRPESVQKIKDALTGKPLSQENRENMSKSHQQNKLDGKLPQRRKHLDLPKYIYHVITADKEGYEIRHHPKLKQRQFTSKKMSMEENLQRAIDYIADENNPDNQREQKDVEIYKNLPRYVRQVVSEKYEGFEVKFHPTLQNKKWTASKYTMDEKLNFATDYLNTAKKTEESSETK
jgi:group I intron endonuclease